MGRIAKRSILIACGLVIAILVSVGLALSLSQIADFELPQGNHRTVAFMHDDNRLEGTLLSASADGPVVVLVHGDGAQDRWSEDGYLPLVNALADAGISVFSWDKPGVGNSEGNWLHQSMENRAEETVAAMAAVQQLPGFEDRSIGLLGFSQAGWVLPRVPTLTDDASFLILMGGAIDWREQGQYYGERRLEREGKTPDEIAAILGQQAEMHREWFGNGTTYEAYIETEQAGGEAESNILSEDRFEFARLNYREDARGDIADLTLPVLILSGTEDLNVDPQNTVSVYADLLDDAHPLNRFVLVPRASHSLLSAEYYNYQLPGQWPLRVQARFVLAGRNAYANGVLDTVARWTFEVSHDP